MRGTIVKFRPGEMFPRCTVNNLPVDSQVMDAVYQIRDTTAGRGIHLEGVEFVNPLYNIRDVSLISTRFYVLALAPDEADYLERMYAAEADL